VASEGHVVVLQAVEVIGYKLPFTDFTCRILHDIPSAIYIILRGSKFINNSIVLNILVIFFLKFVLQQGLDVLFRHLFLSSLLAASMRNSPFPEVI
jgi:hypothetical protein